MSWVVHLASADHQTDHQSGIPTSASKPRRTRGLGHLLGVEHQVAVGAEGARLLARPPRPHAGVRVQAEAEVVLDQVLAADPQVQRVPVSEEQAVRILSGADAIRWVLLMACQSSSDTLSGIAGSRTGCATVVSLL